MALPEDFRIWTKARLAEYAIQNHGKELTGTKAEMLDQLEKLDEGIIPDAKKESVEAPEKIEAVIEGSAPQPQAKSYPDSVKWLQNPETGGIFRATPALREQLFLIPCSLPPGRK